MKRYVVIALLAGMIGTASSRRVVHIPTIAELCPANADWDKLAACVKRQAPFTLIRNDANLKLLHIAGDRRNFGGYYVFTHDKQWQLYGTAPLYQAADLLQFERVTLGSRTGYRIDVGTTSASAISLDGETSIPAVIRYRLTSLCFGGGYCTNVITGCDVLVHGRAYFTFRGKLVHENKQIKIAGDRSRAGQYCAQGELVMNDT